MEIKRKKNLIFEINDNDLYKNRDCQISDKNRNTKNFKKNISITTNNSKEKDNIINKLNEKLTENKKKIKSNQEEITNLINLIKSRELNAKKYNAQRQYTVNEKNFVKNGLNQIYTKTLIKNNEHHKYINKRQNNIRVFDSNIFNKNKNPLKSSESVNNIQTKISLNERYTHTNKKPNFLIDTIKSTNNNNLKSNDFINANTNSAKNIYMPKKATFPKKCIYNHKRNNESPIYLKKTLKNKKITEYYYFSGEKRNRIINNKSKENNNNNNHLRMTYSKKSYSQSNPNFFIKNETNTEINNNLGQKLDFPFLKNFFERDIEDLSSIHNNSSFESCTFDNDEFKNNNICNIIKNRNSVYIRKTKTDKLHFDIIHNNNKLNDKKYSETVTRNKQNPSKINMILYNPKNQHKFNVQKNLRYSNSEVKFSNIYFNNTDEKNEEENNDKLKNKEIKTNMLNFIEKKEPKQSIAITVNKNMGQKTEERKYLLNKIFKKEIMSFHLDDLIIYEERLKNVILAINNNKQTYFECYDFLNYFKNNCDIFKNLNLLIKNSHDLKIIQNGINYILISIIFTFDYSYKQGILNNIILYMKEMLNLTYQNLILIYDYMFKRTLISDIKSIWNKKLHELIQKELDKTEKDTNINFDCFFTTEGNKENKSRIETIKNNTNFIIQSIKIIIKNYKNKNSNTFLAFLKDIHQKASFKEIFYFFQNKILNSNGLFTYLSPIIILRHNSNLFNDITIPYITTTPKKKYSLILGLENTLINYKFDNNTTSSSNKISGFNGILEIRPGLYQFLSDMKKYFELIIFTLYTQKIGDYIINTIEKKEKYFEHRLYVQHSIIIENEFVKEIKRIGRPLDKIIIVDNLPQNYKLNKKNAINIKSYWGKNYNDNILANLRNVLVKIINEGGDLRKGLEKYRNDIIGKVSSIVDI